MTNLKVTRMALTGVLLICGFTTGLKASYYESDLFPIGLTGINPSTRRRT